jgi:acetoin utilization protein AcuB
MLMPPIGRYMTRQPWTLPPNASLGDAHQLMRAHAIRHLPVVANGHVIGVVSERDLLRLQAFVEWGSTTVREAASEPPYTALAEDAADDVLRTMSEQKYGCVVIVKSSGEVEGIFTATDACLALAEVLERAAA